MMDTDPPDLAFRDRGMLFGFDEAGRGPLAGPVAIAIVNFSPDKLLSIHKGELLVGLGDSKKISSARRNKLFDDILLHAHSYKIEFVSPRFIDNYNINQAIFRALSKAISKLPISVKQAKKFFILDGNYKLESNLYGWVFPDYVSIPKADQNFICVSAASILAKVARDRRMVLYSRKYPGYGLEKHMGYGTELHRTAISKLGLSPIHRKSFCKNWLQEDGEEKKQNRNWNKI